MTISHFLLSVCFVSEGAVEDEVIKLTERTRSISKQFQYLEVIYVLPEADRSTIDKLADTIKSFSNIRILLADNSIGYYNQRALAAAEALGDVVLVTTLDQIDEVPVLELTQRVFRDGQTMIGRRAKSFHPINMLYNFMGGLTNHKVNRRYSRSIILQRESLNKMLRKPSFALDLRFPPKDRGPNYEPFVMSSEKRGASRLGLFRRYTLIGELLSNSADRFLRVFSVFSFSISFAAIFYGLYAIAVFVFFDPQAGWFTTAILQASIMFMLASGLGVLTLGLSEFMKRTSGGRDNDIVDELSNLNFFQNLTTLNVVKEDEES